MLNQKNALTLKVLNLICDDETYKVVDVDTILSKFPSKHKGGKSDLIQCLEFLNGGGFIDIKYEENDTYCLTVLPKGRMILEESLFESNTLSKFSKLLIFTSLSSGLMAFLGALIAVLILK